MPTTLKKKIISTLEAQDYESLYPIWSGNSRAIRIIISLTYDKKKLLAWRAIEGIGILSKAIAADNTQEVRNLVNRLLWMIRDESGGIGWSSPEMLGEIVKNNPVLCADIAPIIISFSFEEPLLPGVLWAAGRIGEAHRELMLSSIEDVLPFLDHSSQLIRGLAAWAICRIGLKTLPTELKKLASDSRIIQIYDNGNITEISISSIASAAIEKEV